jgi:putative membrane protein insertion efficiency factor
MKKLLLKTIYGYKNVSRVLREARLPIFIYTDCKFYPSCSDYAVEAINKHGAVKGSVKSMTRILRCSPFSEGGIDYP